MYIYNCLPIKNGECFKTLREILTNKSYDLVMKYCIANKENIKKEILKEMLRIKISYRTGNMANTIAEMFYAAREILDEIYEDGLIDIDIGYNPYVGYDDGFMSKYFIFRCKNTCFIVSEKKLDNTINYLKVI